MIIKNVIFTVFYQGTGMWTESFILFVTWLNKEFIFQRKVRNQREESASHRHHTRRILQGFG